MQPVTHLQNIKASYIREILSVVDSDDILSMAGGLPAPDSFPMHLIADIMPDISADASLFQYTETAGYRPLLEDLRQRYSVPDSHGIIITTGSQQGIDLCTRVFVGQGETVIAEEPCYLGALQVFAIACANVVTVEQQSDGPNLEQLEQQFAKGEAKFFYAVPDFHNPSGCCWSLEKRQQVAELCRRYQILLIEDAPYRDLRFAGEELPLVSSWCPDESIVLRSFSKVVAPGVRIAALITPKPWLAAFDKVKQASDLHSNVPMQKLVLELLNHPGYPAHFQNVLESYRQRHQALAEELATLPADKYRCHPVYGGMFIWMEVPTCDTLELAKTAIDNGVAVVPGSAFYTSPVGKPSALRLNFSHNSPVELKEAVKRLKKALEQFQA